MVSSHSPTNSSDWEIHPSITPDGLRLALYEYKGEQSEGQVDRPVFLLIHGLGQNRLAFSRGPLPRMLAARGAQVFLGELREHGASERSNPGQHAPTNLETLLNFDLPTLIAKTCEIARVESVHYMGHSMGGILGYALLQSNHRIASLTTLAAPVHLGSDRPVLRSTARLAQPFLKRLPNSRIPLDVILRRLASVVSAPPNRRPWNKLNNLWRLGHPDAADREILKEILRNAHSLPKSLLLNCVDLATGGVSQIGTVRLTRAIDRATQPIAAVVAQDDIFAGPRSVQPIMNGTKLRRIIVLPRSGHIDITLGRYSEYMLDQVWSMLTTEA
ncbi:MAG: alpha/beta hydrolase [Myxococcota bacterium]|nr:alpha/beta hydrolase [Myxococcota bacterium]